MPASHTVAFRGGPNVALKVPAPLWEDTVTFYRDTLGLPATAHESGVSGSLGFDMGPYTLWVERAPALGQSEVWLELQTPDLPGAERALEAHGVARCDEIEALPAHLSGFWISSPASTVHFVGPEARSTE